MNIEKCRACDGTRYAKDYSPGPCRACWGTGRQHVPCLPCEGRGGTTIDGWRSTCPECIGQGKLDTLVDASRIDLQRQRAAEAAAKVAPAPVLVEAPRPAPELVADEVVESRVELDDDARRAAAEAWEAAEGSQLRRGRGRRAA